MFAEEPLTMTLPLLLVAGGVATRGGTAGCIEGLPFTGEVPETGIRALLVDVPDGDVTAECCAGIAGLDTIVADFLLA